MYSYDARVTFQRMRFLAIRKPHRSRYVKNRRREYDYYYSSNTHVAAWVSAVTVRAVGKSLFCSTDTNRVAYTS